MADISSIKIPSGDTYTIKDAAARASIAGLASLSSPSFTGTPTAPTPASSSNDTTIATTAFVHNAFTAADAMIFKGTIGSTGATTASLPDTHYQGWTYKVITAGTYAGQGCEVGDMIICIADGTSASNNDWTVVQSNVDGAVTGPTQSTNEHIAVFNGTSGKVIKDSGYAWNDKVNTNQGISNAGKFLVVNSSGNVEPVSMSSWQGGSY